MRGIRFLQADDLLNQAVARDPSFLQAYCLLAFVHDDLYFFNIDHTPARLALAEAAVQAHFAYVQIQAKHTWRGQSSLLWLP